MPVIIKDTGQNNRIEIAPDVLTGGDMRINVRGDNNHILIGNGTRLVKGLIEIRNKHSTLKIGEHCVLTGTFRLRANYTHLFIGDQTTMMGGKISLHEAGTIRVGRDCMLSGNIHIDVSDMHSIIDVSTGKRINPPADVEIGDHVWIARSVQILKGSRIGENCMVGAAALVNGDFPEGSLLAGVPARVLRSGITWDRRRLPLD
jgi:acetyltransferase-like isoleucine patch superfamily enzyme